MTEHTRMLKVALGAPLAISLTVWLHLANCNYSSVHAQIDDLSLVHFSVAAKKKKDGIHREKSAV